MMSELSRFIQNLRCCRMSTKTIIIIMIIHTAHCMPYRWHYCKLTYVTPMFTLSSTTCLVSLSNFCYNCNLFSCATVSLISLFVLHINYLHLNPPPSILWYPRQFVFTWVESKLVYCYMYWFIMKSLHKLKSSRHNNEQAEYK